MKNNKANVLSKFLKYLMKERLETESKINKRNDDYNMESEFPNIDSLYHHFNLYPNHIWIKSKDEISSWLESNDNNYKENNKHYIIHEDLTVSLKNGTIDLSNKKLYVIPVQFRECLIFKANNNELKSSLGSPYLVNELHLKFNKLNSFVGINKFVEKLDVSHNKIYSFVTMPNFKSELSINLEGNLFSSWDEFKGCDKLVFWANEENEENLSLLKRKPENINEVRVNGFWNSVCFKIDHNIKDEVDFFNNSKIIESSWFNIVNKISDKIVESVGKENSFSIIRKNKL